MRTTLQKSRKLPAMSKSRALFTSNLSILPHEIHPSRVSMNHILRLALFYHRRPRLSQERINPPSLPRGGGVLLRECCPLSAFAPSSPLATHPSIARVKEGKNRKDRRKAEQTDRPTHKSNHNTSCVHAHCKTGCYTVIFGAQRSPVHSLLSYLPPSLPQSSI